MSEGPTEAGEKTRAPAARGRVDVSIVIPTQRRPGPLRVAAASALRQSGVEGLSLELVIADNDQVPSARPIADRLGAEAPFPVIYVHEPKAGVANVRNAALGAARGDLIAFLDDDEEAPEGWLAALLAAQARFGADVVFGPVRARAPAEVVRHRAYLEHFFSRHGPAEAGLIADYHGCGDSLVRRAALPHPHRPFSAIRNRTGGEDDLLFGAMQAAGARFAWAPEAWVWEDPAPERLNLGYTILRAFAYGHGPSAHCAAASPPDWPGVARWMLIGIGQAAVYGLLALVQWMVRAPDRAFSLDRAARGLGKTLWWGPFRINFYGRAAPSTDRSAPVGAAAEPLRANM
jgi:hypothetical protein